VVYRKKVMHRTEVVYHKVKGKVHRRRGH
jgi:hypothetical protein